MLRFFRSRAPLFGLLLLVALLVTLPGIRHPLPLLGLTIFTLLAWRAIVRWRTRAVEEASLDDLVEQSAAAWDARHAPPEDAEFESSSESWRESLQDDDAWRGRDDT